MRIGIQTWGSAGDVRPMIALAAGLKAAGHEVRLVATPVDGKDYRPLAAALSIPYEQAPEAIAVDLPGMAAKVRPWHMPRRLMRLFFETTFFPFVEAMYAAAGRLAETSDLLVGHFMAYPAKVAAQERGIPFVSVTYWPGFAASPTQPGMGMPDLGRRLNGLGRRLIERIVDAAALEEARSLWLRAGLMAPRRVVSEAWGSDTLSLLAASPALWPPDPAWARHHRLCGEFAVPESAEPWEMPASLRQFLDAGDPPVYMTFGSSQLLQPERGTELHVAAAREAGGRAIIQTCSPKRPAGSREGSLYFVGPAVHSRLFPRCAAVVHHGGAGTTHAATRAGRPSVVVAFMGEQVSWGQHLQRLGISPAPLRYRWVTPGAVARAIRTVLDSPGMSLRARELAEAMRAENGVRIAVAQIERLMRR